MMNMPLNLTPPAINPNAEKVLSKRYYRKDENGQCVEDATGLFWRVASSVAAEEAKYEQSPWKPDALARAFYDMMTDWRFLPNSPTLMNAGSELGQLSACFVLPVGDSIEEIFDAVKFAAMIHKSGGGTGFSFSRLRPKNSRVGTTGGVASGPVSFLRIFNTATEQIKQGGTRRGANMGILRVDHPDILEFIDCKKVNGDITNFNISVGITEAFMQAVEENRDYDLIDPQTRRPVGKRSARELFEKIVDAAWRNGEPGIIFLDRLNRDNVVPAQGEIESTNPCGEQPLLPYESCNLGSINLVKMLAKTPEGYAVDYGLLRDAAAAAEKLGVRADVGQVFTSDQFYNDNPAANETYRKFGILAVEMETAGIYWTAQRFGKRALSILTISDHIFTGEALSAQERQDSFHEMMEIALETAWNAAE